MKVADFFREHKVVLWTLEYMKNVMNSEIPGLDREYTLGEPMLVESSFVENRKIFPMIVIELIPHHDETSRDYLYYIPETSDIRLWFGKMEFRKASPIDIGKRFVIPLEDGKVEGKIAVTTASGKNEFCFQFKHDYNHEKKNH